MEKEPIVCVTPSELVKWKLRYGFIHCKWPINEWDNVSAPAALALTTEKTVKLGEKVERHLDPRPNKTTVEYEKFHHAHFGQTGKPLLSCFPAKCNWASSKHATLSLHRQLWQFADHVEAKRNYCQRL